MTTVTFMLEGKRGAKYRLSFGQAVTDEGTVGDGVVVRLQKLTNTEAFGATWRDVASTLEYTGDAGCRILAGWLMTNSDEFGVFKGKH